MHHVTSSQQLNQVFAHPASGLTPITPVLKHVLQEKKAVALEKNLLIIIATDGAPTNAAGEIDTAALKHVLVSERNIEKVGAAAARLNLPAVAAESCAHSFLGACFAGVRHFPGLHGR